MMTVTKAKLGIRVLGIWVLCVGLMLAGCKNDPVEAASPAPQTNPVPQANPDPPMKHAPPTPIAVKKQELGDDETWDPQWDVYIEQVLSPEMLGSKAAHDVRGFCPRFSTMSEGDKRAFWAYFFQALAGAEAGLKPTTTVRHTQPEVAVIDPVTKKTVRQQGLLQLAYMDSDRYGCDFDWEKDKGLPLKDPARTILQPKNNLECGVKILDNQLFTLNKPLLSSASYWSTLQPGTVSYRVFAKQMTNVPSACHAVRRMEPEVRVAEVEKQ
jgi:hypothetical protein